MLMASTLRPGMVLGRMAASLVAIRLYATPAVVQTGKLERFGKF